MAAAGLAGRAVPGAGLAGAAHLAAAGAAGAVQGAGEDDRHQRPRRSAVAARELAQHPHAAEGAVVEVLPEPLLEPSRPLGERRARPGVDLEQGQRGEVADDLVDLRVQRQAG